MNTKEAMQIPKFNDKYLDTFFREKELRSKTYRVNGHSIPTGVVLEHIAQTRGREREQIKDIIRKIDFKNGNLHHFFEHLAKGIAERYDQQGRQASMDTKEALIKLGSENPELQKNIRPVIAELEKNSSVTVRVKGNSLQDVLLNCAESYLEKVASLIAGDLDREDRFRPKIKNKTVEGRGWSVKLYLDKLDGKNDEILMVMSSSQRGSESKVYSKHESAGILAWEIVNYIRKWL